MKASAYGISWLCPDVTMLLINRTVRRASPDTPLIKTWLIYV